MRTFQRPGGYSREIFIFRRAVGSRHRPNRTGYCLDFCHWVVTGMDKFSWKAFGFWRKSNMVSISNDVDWFLSYIHRVLCTYIVLCIPIIFIKRSSCLRNLVFQQDNLQCIFTGFSCLLKLWCHPSFQVYRMKQPTLITISTSYNMYKIP